MMIIAIGAVLAGFTIVQFIITIHFRYKDDFETSRECEKLFVLYLIAALICFK